MNSELQIFDYGNYQIRTMIKNGEPWWVLKDVCDVLKLTNPIKVATRLDDDEKNKIDPNSELGSRSNEPITIINESGLYNVILRSDKPEAKKFKKWITAEVLPSIRKYGAYVVGKNADTIDTLLTALQKEHEHNKNLQKQLTEQANKILFADAFAVSNDAILVRDFAKILQTNGIDIGQKKLFEVLREHGFLIKGRNTDFNTPTQRAIDLDLFRVERRPILHSDGRIIIAKTPKITGKGQQYLLNYFMRNFRIDRKKEKTNLNMMRAAKNEKLILNLTIETDLEEKTDAAND